MMRRTRTLTNTRRLNKRQRANIAMLGAALLALSARAMAEPNESTAAQASSAAVSIEKGAIRRVILVSIPDRQLALMEGDLVLKTYHVAVGAHTTPSPIGQFTVINRIVAPSYHHKGKTIPPGRSNPLGSRWIGLSKQSYGIHGTNEPSSIGRAASHGCIRMHKKDVEELFELVGVGDVVEIHGVREAWFAAIFGGPEGTAPAAPLQAALTAPQVVPAVMAAMADQL